MERSERDRYLDSVLVGGRDPARIVIAPYDPAWVAHFAAERDRIAVALGDRVRCIEHVGSTSVPGLAAKPIVDILVTVAEVDESTELTGTMEQAGYELRVHEPGHLMFRTSGRDVQVHVLSDGDPEVQRMLRFRDRLRASVHDRRTYEELKRSLASRQWEDLNDYADAKGPFIEEVLGGAGDR
jgi:GrpB-like predicted nucleotidyltransferase (UPF0157 family)